MDFQGSATAGKVAFDQTIQAKSFRFIVKSGAGDGQGFASCAEMEFYAKNPVNFDYSTLFTDASCSELKNGITEDDIAKCEYPFFKNIAYYMIKGKYPAEFVLTSSRHILIRISSRQPIRQTLIASWTIQPEYQSEQVKA